VIEHYQHSMPHTKLKPLDEVIEMTDLANIDARDIMYELKNQREKLEGIESKNRITKGLLRSADELSNKIFRRKRIIGVVMVMMVIFIVVSYVIYKIRGI
ncbi:hypothetical protein THOM_0958, partial [Trachipleistophora hominis]